MKNKLTLYLWLWIIFVFFLLFSSRVRSIYFIQFLPVFKHRKLPSVNMKWVFCSTHTRYISFNGIKIDEATRFSSMWSLFQAAFFSSSLFETYTRKSNTTKWTMGKISTKPSKIENILNEIFLAEGFPRKLTV